MKQWPKIGSKIIYKGTHMFWFTNIVNDANELLEIGREYTISKLELASSWCGVVVEEFPEKQFALSFFTYNKELTSEEVNKLERESWETVKYEFVSLKDLKDKTLSPELKKVLKENHKTISEIKDYE